MQPGDGDDMLGNYSSACPFISIIYVHLGCYPSFSSTHPSQQLHLIHFQPCFLFFRCCPDDIAGLTSVVLTFPFTQSHWHPPVAQHTTASLPVHSCSFWTLVMVDGHKKTFPSALPKRDCVFTGTSNRIPRGDAGW